MRLRIADSGVAGLLVLPTLVAAVNFDCSYVQVNKHKYDFSKLGGDHAVHWTRDEPPSVMDTVFSLNICKNLARNRDLPKAEQCTTGTRICAVEYANNTIEDTHTVNKVIPISGNYEASHGRGMDPQFTRLKDSASNSDSKREGLRVELYGGRYPDTRAGTDQKAVIEFECDPDRTGLEGLSADEEAGKRSERDLRASKDEEEEDDDDEKEDDKASLRFISYGTEGELDKRMDVLRLLWKTKYACETVEDDKPAEEKPSNSWGFFTWFIIILFLGVATYLIFGSWLNYNRYGARGWDLLPHGDTIRDMPYIASDWVKSCVNAVQGHGPRGGYSAV